MRRIAVVGLVVAWPMLKILPKIEINIPISETNHSREDVIKTYWSCQCVCRCVQLIRQMSERLRMMEGNSQRED